MLRLHMVSDQTAERHPSSSKAFIEINLAEDSMGLIQHERAVSVSGDLLALVLSGTRSRDSSGYRHLQVWDWKTGHRLLVSARRLPSQSWYIEKRRQRIDCTGIVHATFLDDRHIIVPVPTPDKEAVESPVVSLAVVDCLRYPAAQIWLLEDQIYYYADTVLQLPPLRPRGRYTWIEAFRCDRSAAYTNTDGSATAPFIPCADSGLLVASIRAVVPFDSPQSGMSPTRVSIAIPVATIFSFICTCSTKKDEGDFHAETTLRRPTHSRLVPWKEWGHNTSLLPLAGAVTGCDSRIVLAEEVKGHGRRVAVIYDFASTPALLNDTRELAAAGHNNTLHYSVPPPLEVGPHKWDELTASEVVPAIPYRRVVTDIELRSDEVVGLYGDGLFVYGDWQEGSSP